MALDDPEEDGRVNDEADEWATPPTDRRTFLRAASASALAGAAALAGCTTGTRRYEADSVSLAPRAEDGGYSLEDESTSEVSREQEVAGSTLEVTLVSHLASYGRTGSDFVGSVSVGLASTPAAEEAGVALNPVADRPIRDLLTGDVGEAFLQQVDVGTDWQRGPRELATRRDQMLGHQVQFRTFAGVTAEGDFALLNVVRVRDGDDAVLVGDSRTRPVESGGTNPFLGEDGYVTQATVDEAAGMFADLLPLVVHGGDVPSPPSRTATTGAGTPTGSTEGSVVARHTDEVEQAPDQPREFELPPEGYPGGEQRREELKERALRGELPQPPAAEVQMDGEPGAQFAGAADVGGAGTQSSISVGTEFAAWNNSNVRSRPSDANIAVGRDKVVVAVNRRWGIYDKSSGNRQYQVDLEDWWDPVLPENETFVFDPKALYDHDADRFVMIAVARNGADQEGSWVVAVSDDGNPFGTWWITRIGHSDGSTWVDYPGFGLDDNGIYLTANIFGFSSGFQYSKLVSIDKSPLYNGNSFTYWWWNDLENPDGSNAFTVQPSHGMSSSESQYMVNSRYGQGNDITLWELSDPTGSPRLSNQRVSVSSYGMPPNGKQPNTNNPIDTGDTRLMNAVYANGSVWTAHAISYNWNDEGDAEALLKWYEIDVANGSVAQSRGWGRPDGYYCFPTVATDAETSTMLVYNETGPSTAPRIEVAGRTTGHTQNSLEDVALLQRGEAAFDVTSGEDRWGDYNGIVVDPAEYHYWAYSQYGLDSNNTREWESWVAEAYF